MIEIHRTDALIGIRTTHAEQSIQQPMADMQVRQKHPRVEIHSEQVRVILDQQECFNESGLMDTTALLDDMKQRSEEAVLEGIGRRVDEGNSMAAIENGGNAIAEIAFSNSFDNKEFNVVAMPRSRPKIDFVGGTVDIRVDEGTVDIGLKVNPPIIDVKLGDVDIFLRQQPSLSFRFVDSRIDTKV